MKRLPILLDLYCGVGGAARGYQDAGFYVIGVDHEPQPDYAGDDFIQDDVLSYLRHVPWKSRRIVAAHASPPCQASSALTKGTNKGRQYEQLIPQTRKLLSTMGLPTIIENVQGSDLRRDLTLCGEMFGLDVIRHRYFECNFPVVQLAHIKHRGRVKGYRHGVNYEGVYFAVYGEGGFKGTVEEWRGAMGIDWTWDRKSIAEALPPRYTHYVGEQLMKHLEGMS